MEKFEKYVGQVLDRRYRIEKMIGVGGMAVVFEATDLAMNRTVAIKMLKEDIAGDVQAVRRFVNESKAVAMLSHPNIVQVYDVSVRDDLKYIVMERVCGITLKTYMQKKGILSLPVILSYSEQILRALEHAHSKGIIHRDIKPQNIMLLKNGKIKVTDFGIAKLPNAETVTMTDKAIGTVYYISPEQASGKPIDPRSDLYSLGVCMYEMATGTLPFTADSPVSVALMQVNEKPRPPREIVPDIQPGLEQIILGAMEKNPEFRFQNATQMLRHIEQLKADPAFVFRTRRRPREETGADTAPSMQNGAAPSGSKSTTSSSLSRIIDAKAVSKYPMKPKKQSRSMFPIILGVTSAFLLVMIVFGYRMLTLWQENERKNTPLTVEVPTLVGSLLTDEMQAELTSMYYTIELKYIKDDSYELNTILKQDPAAGSIRNVSASNKCVLTLTVSRSEEDVIMPNLLIFEHRAAQQALLDLGLKYTVEKEYNSNVDIGYVYRTDPEAGTVLKPGATVTIYVSRGSEIIMVQVPDFVGKTERDAYRAMLDADGNPNLTVGTVTYEYSDTVGKGRIIWQSKTAYTSTIKGTKINFRVSLGPEPVETVPIVTEPTETEPVETVPTETEAQETTPETAPPETPETDPDTGPEPSVNPSEGSEETLSSDYLNG